MLMGVWKVWKAWHEHNKILSYSGKEVNLAEGGRMWKVCRGNKGAEKRIREGPDFPPLRLPLRAVF